MAYLGLYTPSHEKRRYGLFWGLSGDLLRLLKNLSWACPGFGAIPAPVSWPMFGAIRRVFAGLEGSLMRFCWAGFTAIVGLQEGAEVNFLFVLQRGTKMRGKRLIPRVLLLNLILIELKRLNHPY